MLGRCALLGTLGRRGGHRRGGGGSSANAAASLVSSDDGAFGDGSEGGFVDMVTICFFLFIFGLATLLFSEGGWEK